MKHASYFDRALRARDPRYARLFGKLGYDTTALTADGGNVPPAPAGALQGPDGQGAQPGETAGDVPSLRKRLKDLTGKNVFPGWDAATLLAKIAEAEQAGN